MALANPTEVDLIPYVDRKAENTDPAETLDNPWTRISHLEGLFMRQVRSLNTNYQQRD